MKPETIAIHAGRRVDPSTGAIALPIHVSTTFERSAEGKYPTGFSYGRENNPNRQALEQCLAALEGGTQALVLGSGMAVFTAVLLGMEPGDHVLLPDDVYYGLRSVATQVFGKWPIEVSHADMTDLEAVRAAMRPTTRLVWVETPSNPLLAISNLRALFEIARKANAMSICDATFSTPILQRPLDFGIDMVMHSTTKYMAGHSDAMGGVLITKFDNYLFERVRKAQQTGGLNPGPFDCWLTLRGLETLPYRVRAQAANALELALWLESHPRVDKVFYPGLAGHPGHSLAKEQMSAYGGMLSFLVKGDRQSAMNAAARVQLFTRATSLGSTHSLIEHRASVEGPRSRTPQNLLRVSVGLEHADDLKADLDQALGG